MSDVSERFDEVLATINDLPDDGPIQMDQEFKLKMYGLYKQATEGDVHGDKPGMFDMVGKFKYQAWEKNKGMSQEDAKQAYIEAAEGLAEEHGETI